jgi:hypothetical protein
MTQKREFNLVLGSRPQLRLPIISDVDDKIHPHYIPNSIADGNIVVVDGRVGIGTADPQAKLHVVGNVIVENGFIDARVGTYESSLEYFGCVRDGIVDDTACIQAALDSGISEVIVVPGTYRVAGTLFADSPVTIRGWRGESIILKNANTQNPLFVVESPGITFEDLTMRGVRAHNGAALSYVTLPASTRQSAIAVLPETGNVRVERCAFEQFAKGVVASNVSVVTIDACTFDTFNTAISTSNATDVRVSRSVFVRQGTVTGESVAGGHAWTSNVDARPSIVDSRFENCADPYVLSLTGATRNASAERSVLANVAGFAIATDCENLEIDGVVGTTSAPALTITKSGGANVRASASALSLDVTGNATAIAVRGGAPTTLDDIALRYAAAFREPPVVIANGAPHTEIRRLTVTAPALGDIPIASVVGGVVGEISVLPPPTQSYVACVGSFDLGAGGLGNANAAVAAEVVNVDPHASADANVAVFALTPNATYGLSAPTVFKTIAQYANATIELDTVGGRSAVSLSMPTNMAPIVGGNYVSDPESAVEYSHRLGVPPLPGSFRLFGKIYVESAFSTIVDYDVPLFYLSAIGSAHLSVSGGGAVTLHVDVDSVGAGTVISTDAWHDIEIFMRRGTDIAIVVDGTTTASAVSAHARPMPEALYVGSEGWRHGIWTTGLTQEICDPILRNLATVRGDARMVGNVSATGSFVGDGSLLGNISASSVVGNVECTFM